MGKFTLCPGNFAQACSHFNKCRLEGQFSDVVFEVGDEEFRCHRIVLRSASEYFRAMFSDSFDDGKKDKIKLNSVDPFDFELFLTIIYGGSVDDENVCRLMKICNFFGAEIAENACIDFIINGDNRTPLDLAVDTFVFACACMKKSNQVIEKLRSFMALNFAYVSKYQEFIRVPGDELLLIFNELNLNKEISATLPDFLVQWVNFHADEGRKLLPDLVAALPELSYGKRALKLLINNALLRGIHADKNMTVSGEGFPQTVRPNEEESHDCDQNEINPHLGKVRNYEEKKLPFIFFIADNREMDSNNTHVYVYSYRLVSRDNLYNLRFVNKHGYRKKRGSSSYSDLNCKTVEVSDGKYRLSFLSVVKKSSKRSGEMNRSNKCRAMFSPFLTNNLKTVTHLQKCNLEFDIQERRDVSNHSAVTVIGTNVYLYSNYGRTVRIYNTNRNEWDHFPLTGQSDWTLSSNLVSHENSLYLVGGKYLTSNRINDLLDGKQLQHCDIREGKWSKLSPMLHYRNQASACVHGDLLYVSGSEYFNYYGHGRIVEYYDMRASKWNELQTSLPKPKMKHSSVVWDSKLWFFGGMKCASGGKNKLEPDLPWFFYDLEQNVWSDTFSLPKSPILKLSTNGILDVAVDHKD